jgi:hypothetical protein
LECNPDVGIKLDKTLPWKVILILLWSLPKFTLECDPDVGKELEKPHLGE